MWQDRHWTILLNFQKNMDPINYQISKFGALADTNVLYPSYLRDLLLRLALKDSFRLHWSESILGELRRVLKSPGGLSDENIEYMIGRMNAAFPDALITGEEAIILSGDLPDEDDEHVVLAAVRAHCDVIVTANVKHFPAEILLPLGLEVQHPDEFLSHHLSLERDMTLGTVKEHIKALKKPELTFDQYLECLVNAGLVVFPSLLKEAEGLIVA